MADLEYDESIEVIIRDSATSDNELAVNEDGSINVEYAKRNPITIDDYYIQNSQNILSNSTSLILSATVPSDKTWYITNWVVGGRGKGTAVLAVVDSSNVTHTLLDSADSLTNWTKGGAVKSYELDTIDKYEGTASIKALLDFSGAGIQNGKLTKVYNPTLDLTPYDTIALWAKAQYPNCSIYLKIFQGANSYAFSAQNIAVDTWTRISFDLSEIIAFTPNAVDKIEYTFVETVDLKKDTYVWIDYIHGTYGEIKNIVHKTYFCQFCTNNIIYPRYLILPSNSTLNTYITNNDSTELNFSASYIGFEV